MKKGLLELETMKYTLALAILSISITRHKSDIEHITKSHDKFTFWDLVYCKRHFASTLDSK